MHIFNFFFFSAPSIHSLSVVRTDSLLFNVTIQFNYYGGRGIDDIIKLGYKPVDGGNEAHYSFINHRMWQSLGLTQSALVPINDASIVRKRIKLFVRVTNSNGRNVDSNTVQEYVGKFLRLCMENMLLCFITFMHAHVFTKNLQIEGFV